VPERDEQKREPLAIVRPDKPVSEMTDEEIDALADELYDEAAAKRPTTPESARALETATEPVAEPRQPELLSDDGVDV
jgi:hypothetical protein